MRNLGIAAILFTALALVGCGSSSNNNAINGNWTATLTGSEDLSFTATLTQSGSAVSVTNLSFTTSQSCFSDGATATGAFTLAGTTGGVTTGTFQMTVQSGTSNTNGTNQLTLAGNLSNNTITGNWTLTGTGAGCVGSGSFTMMD